MLLCCGWLPACEGQTSRLGDNAEDAGVGQLDAAGDASTGPDAQVHDGETADAGAIGPTLGTDGAEYWATAVNVGTVDERIIIMRRARGARTCSRLELEPMDSARPYIIEVDGASAACRWTTIAAHFGIGGPCHIPSPRWGTQFATGSGRIIFSETPVADGCVQEACLIQGLHLTLFATDTRQSASEQWNASQIPVANCR